MSRIPAVSVVMSVRNGERYLAPAVESVLAQSHTDFELVVLDDGSTDSSPQILAAYAATDDRVLVHRHEPSGLATSLNRGVAQARSPLIARLDADDVAQPHRLAVQLAYLAQHPAVGLVGGAVAFIDEDGRQFAEARYPTSDAEIRQAFDSTTPFVHSAVTMRREAFVGVGGYRAAFPHAEDLDLWLRIGERWKLANLAEIIVSYRIHPRQSTVTELERQSLSALGARVSWRARTEGLTDPLDQIPLVDRQALQAAGGVGEEEMTAEFVSLAVWLAKTLSRSGREDNAAELFALAEDRARSRSGSRTLLAFVKRQQARRLREQNRPLAAVRADLAAKLAEKRRRGRR